MFSYRSEFCQSPRSWKRSPSLYGFSFSFSRRSLGFVAIFFFFLQCLHGVSRLNTNSIIYDISNYVTLIWVRLFGFWKQDQIWSGFLRRLLHLVFSLFFYEFASPAMDIHSYSDIGFSFLRLAFRNFRVEILIRLYGQFFLDLLEYHCH